MMTFRCYQCQAKIGFWRKLVYGACKSCWADLWTEIRNRRNL